MALGADDIEPAGLDDFFLGASDFRLNLRHPGITRSTFERRGTDIMPRSMRESWGCT